MAFITEIKISARKAFEMHLTDCYAWHRFLWRFFHDESRRNFLFRTDDMGGAFRVYAISETAPRMEEPLVGVELRNKEIPETFLSRKRYAFEVRLNPVRSHVVRDANGVRKKNGKRLTVSLSELPVWINEKFLKGGMRILHDPELGLECEISPITRKYFVKDGKRAFHASVDIRGVLEVEDPRKFRKTFLEGIGHARAFGFGMLILK